eukprot:12078710-Ditylum_brightwellii.AAC.1
MLCSTQSQSSKVALALDKPNYTSELGDKNKLNTEHGQIVKTPPVPLLPASITASASSTYLLKQDIDGISDCTDDGISDGIDDDTALGTCDGATLNVGLAVVLNAEGTWDGATLGVAVKVKSGNKQESTSKGGHNPDHSPKIPLQVPLPPTLLDPKLSLFGAKEELSANPPGSNKCRLNAV